MKRLVLLRHAKSAWPKGMEDHERPLASRGIEAAHRVGAYLMGEHLLPDCVLVSSANRTQETWRLVLESAQVHNSAFNPNVKNEPRLYQAPASLLLEIVQATLGDACLMLVAHNPGMEELARLMTGYGDRYAYARLTQKYPTAGLTVLDFDVNDWGDVTPRSGRLDRFVTPQMLGMDYDED